MHPEQQEMDLLVARGNKQIQDGIQIENREKHSQSSPQTGSRIVHGNPSRRGSINLMKQISK